MSADHVHRRDDPPGEPVHTLDPPVEVLVAVGARSWAGRAHRWRGRWVHVEWSEGPGMTHLEWLPAVQVVRKEPELPDMTKQPPPPPRGQ